LTLSVFVQIAGLHVLHERGKANSVPDLSLVSGAEVRRLEPHIVGTEGLLSPHTGIACFDLVARSYARDLQTRGGVVRTNFELVRATSCSTTNTPTGTRRAESGLMELHSATGDSVRARHVLVCGGLYADRLASRIFGGSALPTVVPVRGTWLQLRPEHRHLVSRNIYPVPDARFPFLGVHLTPTLDPSSGEVGGIIVGPNASLATSREGYDWTVVRAADVVDMLRSPALRRLVGRHLAFGASQLAQELFPQWAALKQIQRYAPKLRWEHILSARPFPFLMPWLERPVLKSGMRAQALTEDGKLEEDFVFEAQMQLARRNTPAEDAALSLGHHSDVTAADAAGDVRPAVVSLPPAAILHVRNAPSPAATSSLAIAERVAARAEQVFQL
jgi:L-2-hydroxyglutarate oxidase LhgO